MSAPRTILTKPLARSIFSLYALGMSPKAISARLWCSAGTVKVYLTILRSHWSADSWRTAARMWWESETGVAL